MFCILILYMYLQNYIAIEPFAPSPPINKCTIQLTKFYDICQLYVCSAQSSVSDFLTGIT